MICPVLAFKINPVGRLGDTVKTLLPYPPSVVTGVNGVATTFAYNETLAMASVVVNAGGVIVRENVLDAVCPA